MTARVLTAYRHIPILFLLAALLVALTGGCAQKTQMPPSEKVSIQNAMNAYILEKTAREGGYFIAEGTRVEFDYLHDGVKPKGDQFISCADFKAGKDIYDLDYYVEKIDGRPTVVKEVLHKKNGEKVNQVLWEK